MSEIENLTLLPHEGSSTWAKRFELLGDPTRLALLSQMHLHPHSAVQDLAQASGVSQTAASQALRILREEGWVQAERDGRQMRYTLVDDTIHRILHLTGQTHHNSAPASLSE